MRQRARFVLREDRLRRADLHVDHRQIMAEAIVYLARQTVALFRSRQLFDLRGVLAQTPISCAQLCPRLALARSDPREDHDEDDARAVSERNGDGVNPTTA